MIVYVDRSRVNEGTLDELKTAMTELTAFVEANEPDILSYNVYFDEDEARMTVLHVHDDSDSLAFHMDVAGSRFPPIGEFIEMESIDVYGRPSEAIVETLREKASTLGSGRVRIHDLHRSFERVVDG